jgi:hypothetical protein
MSTEPLERVPRSAVVTEYGMRTVWLFQPCDLVAGKRDLGGRQRIIQVNQLGRADDRSSYARLV